MSLDELQFPNGHLDVVFSQNVLEHVHDLERAWAEIKRVLKPGDLFVTEFGPCGTTRAGTTGTYIPPIRSRARSRRTGT